MREILFKGKRKDNGEWVQGYYVETLRYNNLHWIWDGKEYIAVDPETIGQYTGLTDCSEDKNRIFENSIIRCKHEWTGIKTSEPFNIDKLFEIHEQSVTEIEEQFEQQKIRGAYGKYIGSGFLGNHHYYYYRNYVVEYYAPKGKYRIRNGSVFYDLTSNFLDNHEAVVIGNLADNPELLKGGVE